MNQALSKSDVEKRTFDIYKGMTIGLMNQIEDATGTMMHELDAQLERRCWAAIDQRNTKELRKIHLELCELHDNKTMDN